MSGENCGGCLKWIECDMSSKNAIKDFRKAKAVYAGATDSPLYVGRVRLEEDKVVLPAAISENDRVAYYAWDSTVGQSTIFEVLISKHKHWKWVKGSKACLVPENAVLGGWFKVDDKRYYVGRLILGSKQYAVPGQIDADEKTVCIPYKREERKCFCTYKVSDNHFHCVSNMKDEDRSWRCSCSGYHFLVRTCGNLSKFEFNAKM